MIKSYFNYLYMSAHAHNNENILQLFEKDAAARILDLGCFDGEWTTKISDQVGSKNLFGVEILPAPATLAKSKGIHTLSFDLNTSDWPLEDNSFDVVHSSFVIEHVFEIDRFLSEIFRILKPGGYAVTSTENGSSWHNIIAAIMGWQTFSSSCCSTKLLGVGNPLAIHRGKKDISPSMTHKMIFNYRGFKEIFYAHGFENVKLVGAGYYPLPSLFGSIDIRHSHFITARSYKGLH